MSMRISTLRYGALLSYSPRGLGKEEDLSRSFRTAIKNDESIKEAGSETPMSRYVAEYVLKFKGDLPFGQLFDSNPTLVPVRSSSLQQPHSLWTPFRIATELQRVGLGRKVEVALSRTYSLPKSATSKNRPSAVEQYASLQVQKLIEEPDNIILVDDVVTSGATLIGSANRLADAYPEANIVGFAAMRTVSDPKEFKGVYDSVFDDIILYPSGKTHRNP